MHENRQQLKQQQWEALKAFIARWWYKIDYQALLVILSTYASHFYLKESPVWLLVLGGSGTGKSAIAIRSIESLDCVYSLADMTPNTFLSGYAQSGGGLLEQITQKQGGNAIFSISDMATITAKRPDVAGEIIGIFRKMYDGSYSKIVGSQKEEMKWEGKITCIAAGTWDVERHWAMHRSLGERFVQLHWKQGTDDKAFNGMVKFALKQIGKEEYIKDTFKKLVREFVDTDNLSPVSVDVLKKTMLKLSPLVRLVSLLRTPIRRRQLGSKESVVEVSDPEGTGRILKVFANIARGSATLFHREEVCKEDLQLAYRVAFDTIPRYRNKVVAALFSLRKQGKIQVSIRDLARRTRIPKTSTFIVVEDLEYLNVIETSTIDGEDYPRLTNKFIKLLTDALNALK